MEHVTVDKRPRFEIERELRQTSLMAGLLHCLQKRRRLEILLLIHDLGKVRWRDVNNAMFMSDMTFRSARDELVKLGLVRILPMGYNTNFCELTDFGCLIADVLQRAVRDIGLLIKSEYNTTGKK